MDGWATIKMLKLCAGPEGVYQPGCCRVVTGPVARQLVACGAAKLVRGIEVAMDDPVVETAVAREPAAKRRRA